MRHSTMEGRKAQGFIALAILLVVVPVALCQNGTIAPTGVSRILRNLPGTVAECSASGVHICGKCNLAPICVKIAGIFQLFGTIDCAEVDPKAPYCNKGECSATPEDDCGTTTSCFTCTSDGYFPDPDDCQQFHFCLGTTAADYSCSAGFVYSHESTACIKKKVSSDCAVIKCPNKTAVEYVVYPKDPSVYGICIRGQKTLVVKCGYEGYEIDTKLGECVFVCKQAGLFPDPVDPTRYIECIANGSKMFIIKEIKCPCTEFSPSKGKCDLPVFKRK